MSAHTPGPWFAERHGIVTADVGGHRRQVASTTGDAVMHGDVSVSVVEIQMANARLIAAAPDLLAALCGLTTWLSTWRHAVSIRAIGAEQAWDELERLHNEGAALAGLLKRAEGKP